MDPEISGINWSTGHWTMGIRMTSATTKIMSELILTGKATIPEEYVLDRFMTTGSRRLLYQSILPDSGRMAL